MQISGHMLLPRSESRTTVLLHVFFYKKAYDLGPSNNGTEIPIMYLNGKNNPYQYWTVHSDDYIEYNEYGEPIYSGIYLEVLPENKNSVFRQYEVTSSL